MAAQATDNRQPRLRVAALMLQDDQIVTVRHRAGSATYHLLPGGGVDWGETLEHALVREVREETGLLVRLGDLLFVNDTIDPNGNRHVVNMTFGAEITGGTITQSPADERVEAVDLVSREGLTAIDLRPPIALQLQEALARIPVAARYLGSVFRT